MSKGIVEELGGGEGRLTSNLHEATHVNHKASAQEFHAREEPSG